MQSGNQISFYNIKKEYKRLEVFLVWQLLQLLQPTFTGKFYFLRLCSRFKFFHVYYLEQKFILNWYKHFIS